MRYVPLQSLLLIIFADSAGAQVKRRLEQAHRTISRGTVRERSAYIGRNGTSRWSPLKDRFVAELGNKCWYTEAELVGGPLTIDHYRPKSDYWFLAFKPENYRVACPFANSLNHNSEHCCAGGKGERFPLLDETKRATGIRSIKNEKPIILDPCNEDDCRLIAFLPDGRPVVHPEYAKDSFALRRVEESKILLNLDHPDFNSKREQLYEDIKREVQIHEILPQDANQRGLIRSRLSQRVSKTAPFSTAARHYLSAYRHLDWVVELLKT